MVIQQIDQVGLFGGLGRHAFRAYLLVQLRGGQLGQFLLGDLSLLFGRVLGTRELSIGRVLIPCGRLALMTSWGTDTCLFSKYVNDIPIGDADICASRALKHTICEIAQANIERNYLH